MEKKRGRPPRKAYAGTYLTLELLETVSAVYAEKQEIKATALAVTAQKSCEKSAPNSEARERREMAHNCYK